MSPPNENKIHASSSSSLITDDYCGCNSNDEVTFSPFFVYIQTGRMK